MPCTGRDAAFRGLEEGQIVTAPFMSEGIGWNSRMRASAWGRLDTANQLFHGGAVMGVHKLCNTVDIVSAA